MIALPQLQPAYGQLLCPHPQTDTDSPPPNPAPAFITLLTPAATFKHFLKAESEWWLKSEN